MKMNETMKQMTSRKKELLLKVIELKKENEKLEGVLKIGRNANQNLSNIINGLTDDNERLTEDNKKLAELNSKLYEENLKLAKDKQHLWEDVVRLKKNVDNLAQLQVETVSECGTQDERIKELEEEKKLLVHDLKSLRELVIFRANDLKDLVDFEIPVEDDDYE